MTINWYVLNLTIGEYFTLTTELMSAFRYMDGTRYE